MSYKGILGKNMLAREGSTCKCPGVGACLAHPRNSKKASTVGVERAGGRNRKKGLRGG